ncbi:MAG: SDR family oxidoreductase [Candidatus Eisenbacteria bacterium]|nr:SDR family oxidoreductase [Candidatus Eisenbacteria bacterium]
MTNRMLEAGHEAYLVVRRPQDIARLEKSLPFRGGHFHSYACDMSSLSEIEKVTAMILQTAKAIDFMVNCVGVLGPQDVIHETSLADWTHVMKVNLDATFLVMRMVLPTLLDNRRGIIMNLTSNRAKYFRPCSSAYSVSKFAVEALTNIADLESKDYGVRCLAVNPGRVATEMRRLAAPDEEPDSITSPQAFAEFCFRLLTHGDYMMLPCSIDFSSFQFPSRKDN